jgi:hypothetical protein
VDSVRFIAGVLLALTVAGCGAETLDSGSVDVQGLVEASAPWATASDPVEIACLDRGVRELGRAAEVFATDPEWARDLETSYEVAMVLANCSGPREVFDRLIESAGIPAAWEPCAEQTIGASAAVEILAVELVGDEGRSGKYWEALADCVLRSDVEVAVDVALRLALSNAGLGPVAGPEQLRCIETELRGSMSEDRILALTRQDVVADKEVSLVAGALVDCAPPEVMARLLSATLDAALDPDCIPTAGRGSAARFLKGFLSGDRDGSALAGSELISLCPA